MSEKVYTLAGNQRGAVNPNENIWLSASAGTGKTQVLSARVLRLLLRPDVDPSQILCLTFTKAGAAEMANRINAILANWVRLEPTELVADLRALGAPFDPATQDRARTLFASVLDCPGGGLRIDTIHAFSQWLIGQFPNEADLAPGARPIEDRERTLLLREVMGEMLSEAEANRDTRLLTASELFTTRKDPGALQQWLMRCAAQEELWEGAQGWQSPMDARVRRLLDIPASADAAWAEEVLDPDIFPDDELRQMLPLMQGWKGKTGEAAAEFIALWLDCAPEARAVKIEGFFRTVLTQTGTPRKMDKPTKQEPRLPQWQAKIADSIGQYRERQALLALAELLTAALELGRAFATRWSRAKQREGLLDFDDLIRKAARLLGQSDAAQWISYKIDRRFDHILIDEAQDTNQAQWDIVEAIIDDFFSGEGAAGTKLRTIFTVGDYKQAIFGFQGTSPENYESARDRIRARVIAARRNALAAGDGREAPAWRDLDLGQSFRTADIVLRFVNKAIETLGYEAFGLKTAPSEHKGDERAGLVALWKPVIASAPETEEPEERDWVASHDSALASRIAQQVKQWISGAEPFVLEKGGTSRLAGPGDIMILVRKRKELAAQIVARLHETGVPVAGVDRLRLGAPLAVRDVMSALRFAAQPLDDLECAHVLTSPLVGWNQQDLLELAIRPKGRSLWDHLRQHADPRACEAAGLLRDLLSRADYETPQAQIAWILTGPWRGRERLVARLGREANDPLDELLNASAAFEASHIPSLAGFFEWFDAGTTDLKRDPDNAAGQVRVLTVHGSKGLQAPIVILADATGEPGQGSDLSIGEQLPGDPSPVRQVPLPTLSKDERAGPLQDAEETARKSDLQEHWRLLYVAMTRAEEALFIGGALNSREAKKGVPEQSWYAALEPVFETGEIADPIWGARLEWGERALIEETRAAQDDVSARADLPEWALRPIRAEPRPPRPLAPSQAGEDLSADPPLASSASSDGQAVDLAARRGVLIHKLLERLPDVPHPERREAASDYLARQARDLAQAQREDILDNALQVLESPGFAELFAPGGLAEVPLSASVGGLVVAGTLDRLLIEDDCIRFIDFKTTRRPPADLAGIPRATMRQMAAYALALEAVYPAREIRAGLLYTQTPQLLALPGDILSRYKQELVNAQESYRGSDTLAY